MNEKENLNSNENQEILPYVDTNVEEFDDNNLNLDEINFVEDEPQVDKETIFWGCPIKKSTNLWLVLTVVLGIIFVVQFFITSVLLTPLQVVGASMYPTYNGFDDDENTSDLVYIVKQEEYLRRDVIIFDSTNYGGSAPYIKRVIGVAGDVIEFRRVANDPDHTIEGSNALYGEYQLFINGVLQEEEYINQETDRKGSMYLEYSTSDGLIYYNTIKGEKITVPEGCVYVLGDNRRISNDSKYLGCIKLEDCMGKVVWHIAYGESVIESLFRRLRTN